MIKDVRILNYTREDVLEKEILKGINLGYTLVGPVTVGTNGNGNVIFLATMLYEEKAKEENARITEE